MTSFIYLHGFASSPKSTKAQDLSEVIHLPLPALRPLLAAFCFLFPAI
ncbi:YqiA/YcfP family alpha/beta fold hydrolase [Sphaerospermopsis sp. LEGE 08334]|nr:YqiA/YcfP family alpha/beta fold hydrolase [Sphaerospermopsis sp. LEGE 08334]